MCVLLEYETCYFVTWSVKGNSVGDTKGGLSMEAHMTGILSLGVAPMKCGMGFYYTSRRQRVYYYLPLCRTGEYKIAVFTKHGITLKNIVREGASSCAHDRNVNKNSRCCKSSNLRMFSSCLMYNKYRTDQGVTWPSLFHLTACSKSLGLKPSTFSLLAECWNNYGLVTPWSVLSISLE